MKQVIQLNADGYFTGLTVADESPLEPGVFLFPANTVDAPVPTIPENQRAKWNGTWVFENIPQPEPEPELPELTPEQKLGVVHYERRDAYRAEADPLFFKVHRGEATQQQWLDKVAEIKARYPKPEGM